MPLLKRIGYYLIGLSIGVIFLIFFFKNKQTEFCYLPNCRVLKEVRENNFKVEPDVQNTLDNLQLTEQDIEDILTYGDVNFSESDTHAEPCRMYIIEAIWKEKEVTFSIKNCPDEAILEKVVIE